MTLYQRMQRAHSFAREQAFRAFKRREQILTDGFIHVRELFKREVIFARPVVTVTVAEVMGTVRREFRATTDVDDRAYQFCAPYVASAHTMAYAWALYTYGREARIMVESSGIS